VVVAVAGVSHRDLHDESVQRPRHPGERERGCDALPSNNLQRRYLLA
jgi:hypothetical protein